MTALIIPVWCQNADTLNMFLGAAETWKQQGPLTVYAPTNRLAGIGPEDLQSQLAERSEQTIKVLHQPGKERSVAGAWNFGIKTALEEGYTDFVITAMDVFWHPYAIDRLVKVGRPRENELTSGVDERQAHGDEITEGCDFSGLYLSDITLKKFGWFCVEFVPSYCEDNDYVAKVWRFGGEIGQSHQARYFHHGSATIKLDAEAAHHVQHWFGTNKRLFVARWGSDPVGIHEEAIGRYDFARPINLYHFADGCPND